MNVVILFEESGVVRRAFQERGCIVISVDLQPSRDNSKMHLQEDVSSFFNKNWSADLIIMHPPCTALAVSGNRWYGRGMPKHEERLKSLAQTWTWFEKAKDKARYVCMENPVGVLGKATQYIQPWQFGHGETKKTGLWLHNLPKLEPTDIVEGREQRVWKMGPSPERAKLRSETYKGIAEAMADQWGSLET